MPGEDTPGAEIVKRSASSPHALERMPLMTDDEIRRSWRLACSLAASNMFKDARQGEQAFAKILVGRDLGITPTQALMGLHFVEGKIEIAAVMMATFVRSRDGYDYRQAWIKETPAARQGERAVREVVYVDEDTAADLRPVVGCAIEFTVDGEMRGVSRWTIEDSERAGLTKDRGSAKSNHIKYPRNMFFARSMSNGCKWIIPEVLAGIPVYVEGEIEAQKALDQGDGDGEPQGLDMGPDVEAVIALAEEKGHAALSDRAAIEMQLGSQAPGYVGAWVKAARKELASIPDEAEVVDAPDAVLDNGDGTATIVEHKTDADRGEPVPPEVAARQAADYERLAGDLRGAGRKAPERTAEPDAAREAPAEHAEPANTAEALAVLRRRATELLNSAQAAEEAGNGEEADSHYAELAAVEANLDAITDPAQETLL